MNQKKAKLINKYLRVIGIRNTDTAKRIKREYAGANMFKKALMSEEFKSATRNAEEKK